MPYTTSRSIKSQKKSDAHVSNPKRVSAPLSSPPEALIDMRELLQFLKLGKTKISALINQEGLPVYKFGNTYRYRHVIWHKEPKYGVPPAIPGSNNKKKSSR